MFRLVFVTKTLLGLLVLIYLRTHLTPQSWPYLDSSSPGSRYWNIYFKIKSYYSKFPQSCSKRYPLWFHCSTTFSIHSIIDIGHSLPTISSVESPNYIALFGMLHFSLLVEQSSSPTLRVGYQLYLSSSLNSSPSSACDLDRLLAILVAFFTLIWQPCFSFIAIYLLFRLISLNSDHSLFGSQWRR